MRRRLELSLVALTAVAVSAIAYHTVEAWPGQPQTVTATRSPGPDYPHTLELRINASSSLTVEVVDGDEPLPLTFEVTGGGEVDVAYFPGPGGAEVRTRVKTPWTETVQAPPHIAANAITLTATATADSPDATVACRVSSSEAGPLSPPLFEDEAYGTHAVARCSAT
ncbi:hypothetical protein [Actinoplanes regularis]|uniref:hypothetical protein n=1 Tax=Actinoplanes regularis TaxID=52697 RepID=UPI00249FEA09|nr:hypothetical protein [Actinoplanes regularis]GLW32851.1 hypothetical protein Areg01_57890 [Actinoplanes regularis]